MPFTAGSAFDENFTVINTVDIRLSHRQIQYQRYEIGSCDHSYFDFLSKSMNHTLSYQGKTTEVWHQFHSFYICTKSPNLITRNPLTCAPIHCCIQLIMIPPTWQTEKFFFEYMLVSSTVWTYKIVYISNTCMKNAIEYGGGDEIVLTNHVYKFTMNAAFEYSI